MSTIERNSNPNSGLRLIYPLSRRKADALPHVAVAPTLKQAARNAGVSYSTLRRWMDDADFRAELERVKEAASALMRAKLQELALKSAANLDEFLNSDNDAIRLRATRIALDVAIGLERDQDIRKRIAHLNRAFAMLRGNR